MNNLDPIENQLRSWKPRSPSGRLKARLFPGTEPAIAEALSPFDGRWAWLAPALACLLVMMVVSGARTNQLNYLSAPPAPDWFSAVASNQSYTAYIASGFHSELNSLQQDPIEWTNRPRASRDVRSSLLAKTNSLIPEQN